MVERIEAAQSNTLLEPLLYVLAAVLIGLFVEFIVLRGLQQLAKRTEWRIDDIIFHALRGMPLVWISGLGILAASLNMEAQPGTIQMIAQGYIILFILSITIVSIRIGTELIKLQSSTGEMASVSILNNIIRVIILLVGLMLAFQYLGISVTPALTALAASSIGISLALQDTLSNLFSGVWLVASNQIRPGHYVRLSTGEEGYVSDINWRTTNIRHLANNMIIVPNAMITSAIVVNYYDPERELSILINVGVSYDSDLEHVERVTIEVGKEVMEEVEGGVPTSDPFIRYNDFSDSSVRFTVILRGQEFVNQYLIKHEFVKRLHKRYRQEGIVIPFPIRTLHIPDTNGRKGVEMMKRYEEHLSDGE